MKPTDILIHTHLGVGDHFICNALIRKFIETTDYKTYHVACKRKNQKTVNQLFSDLSCVSLYLVDSDMELYELSRHVPVLRIGHEKMDQSVNFDVSFYRQMGYDISLKWDGFFIKRNHHRELECYKQEVPEEPYIFVHDSSSVGNFNLNHRTDLTIVRPTNHDWTPIDYLTVIERASEIHCLDSSFLNMIDLCVTHDEKFFHKVKNGQYPIISNSWKMIDYSQIEC